MAKDGRDLVNEAVSDVKALKSAALTAATNQILESMVPGVRKLIDENLKKMVRSEDIDRLRRGIEDNWPGESHTGFEEGKEKGEPEMDKAPVAPADPTDGDELDLESASTLASFFPQIAEMGDDVVPEEDPMAKAPAESMIPALGEGDGAEPAPEDEFKMKEAKSSKKDDEEDEEEKKMDETIEISEQELRKVYDAALKTEAQVTKGFGDMTPAGEIEDVVKDVDKGLADVKKGEHAWEKETAPAKQDFTVKERREVEALIGRGLAENKSLRANLKKAAEIIQTLGAKLHEVNLFNSKVLHVNRLLNANARLTNEQRRVAMEAIDEATTVEEVKRISEAINKSFAAAGKLNESTTRKPTANAQRARTSGAPDQKLLGESVEKSSNEGFSRMQRLAGLVK